MAYFPGIKFSPEKQLIASQEFPVIKPQRKQALPESPQLPGVPCVSSDKGSSHLTRTGVAAPILITSSFPTSDPGAPGHSGTQCHPPAHHLL